MKVVAPQSARSKEEPHAGDQASFCAEPVFPVSSTTHAVLTSWCVHFVWTADLVPGSSREVEREPAHFRDDASVSEISCGDARTAPSDVNPK